MFLALPCLVTAYCMSVQKSQLSFAHLVTPEMALADLLVSSVRTAKCLSTVHQYSQLCSLVLFRNMKKDDEPSRDQEST